MDNQQHKKRFIILWILISFATVCATLYTPALPDMHDYFKVPEWKIRLSLVFFLIGYSLGALPYGPLTHKFGKKNALFIGVCTAIVGALLSTCAIYIDSLQLLNIARLILGIGTAVGQTMTIALITERLSHNSASKYLSYTNSSFAILPALCMLIGGLLTTFLGWQSVFLATLIYVLFVFILVVWFPKTQHITNREALKFKNIKKSYISQWKNYKVPTAGLCMGACTSLVYFSSVTTPFVAIDIIGIKAYEYSLWLLIPFTGMFIGYITSAKLAHRFTHYQCILIGTTSSFLGSLILALFFALSIINVWTLFLPLSLILFGIPFVLSNTSPLGLSHSTDKFTGSSLIGFLNIGFVVIFVIVFSFAKKDNTLVLPIGFLTGSLLTYAISFLLHKMDKRAKALNT